MDIFVLLVLFLNSITVILMQTCREVHEVIHANKYAIKRQISCLTDLTLEQCALECMLVTICTSINHVFNKPAKRTMCELRNDESDSSFFEDDQRSSYVDIRDWPQDVAGACASRPCADNQRCIPTNPYRCMNIDCGIPPVSSYNINAIWTNTTIGARVRYVCRNGNYPRVSYISFPCYARLNHNRICNSDSFWTTQDFNC